MKMIHRSKPNQLTHFYNFLVFRSNFYESLFQSELLWSSFPAPYHPLCRQELVWVGVLKSVPLSSQFLQNCRRPFYKFSRHSSLEFCQIPHSLFFSLRYLLKILFQRDLCWSPHINCNNVTHIPLPLPLSISPHSMWTSKHFFMYVFSVPTNMRQC